MKLKGFLIASLGLFLGACGGGSNENTENDPFALEGVPVTESFYDVIDNLTLVGERYYYDNNVYVTVFETGSAFNNNTIVSPAVDTSDFGFSGSYEGRWESSCTYQRIDDGSYSTVFYSYKDIYNFSGGFLTIDSETYEDSIKCEGEARYSSLVLSVTGGVITEDGIENVDLNSEDIDLASWGTEDLYFTFNVDGSQMLIYSSPEYYVSFDKIQ